MAFWKRKRNPWDIDNFFGRHFFRDLDEEFREMEREIARTFENFRQIAEKDPGEGGPYVYGFSMRVGPDGKPHLEKFGNLPGEGKENFREMSQREPLTDLIERDEEISVIVELPGIGKEDINLDASEDSLTIDVDTEKRKYHKKIELPSKVKNDSAKATYKNGVLEIKLKKLEKKKSEKKGVRIKVE